MNPFTLIINSIKHRRSRNSLGLKIVILSWLAWYLFICLFVPALIVGILVFKVPAPDLAPLIASGYQGLVPILMIAAKGSFLTLIGLFFIHTNVFVHEINHLKILARCDDEILRKKADYIRLGGGPDADTGKRIFGVPFRLGSFPFGGRVEEPDELRELLESLPDQNRKSFVRTLASAPLWYHIYGVFATAPLFIWYMPYFMKFGFIEGVKEILGDFAALNSFGGSIYICYSIMVIFHLALILLCEPFVSTSDLRCMVSCTLPPPDKRS